MDPFVLVFLQSFNTMSLKELFALIGQFAAALAALGIIYRYAVKPLISAIKQISSMYDRVEKLVAQFERNGGTTIRDSLDRIEKLVGIQDQRTKILLGLVPHAIIEMDKEGELIFANRSYLQWTGRTESEVLGNGWVNSIYPDDRDKVRREWSDAINESRAYEARFRLIDSKGKSFVVFTRCYPMADPTSDTLYGWLSVIYRCSSMDQCIEDERLCPYHVLARGEVACSRDLRGSDVVVYDERSS